MTEMTQGTSIDDVQIAADEPELVLPPPRPIPVEMVNIVEEQPNQSCTTRTLAVPQNGVVQVLNADPLRAIAQLNALGATGVVWICHSFSEANTVAAMAGSASDDIPGYPMYGGATPVPYTSTAPLWAVATGAAMQVAVLQERRM